MENIDNLWVWQIPIQMLVCSKWVLMVRRQLLCQIWRCWTRYTFFYPLSGPSIFFGSGHLVIPVVQGCKHGAEVTEAMLAWSSKSISVPNPGLPLFAIKPFLVMLEFWVIPQDVAMNQLWWGTSFPGSGLGLAPGDPLLGSRGELYMRGAKQFGFYLCFDRLDEISRHSTQSARALTQCLAHISR